MNKAKRQKTATSTVEVRPQPQALIVAKAVQFQVGMEFNKGSMFEALAGIRGALIAPKEDSDPSQEVLAMPASKSSIKTLRGHLMQRLWGTVDTPVTGKKVDKYEKILKKAFDGPLFGKFVLPSPGPFTAKVYPMQFFGYSARFHTAGVPHMALGEIRVLLEGTETVLGLPVAGCPGATMADKRHWLFKASEIELIAAVKQHGWMLHHDQTKALFVPYGMITSSFSEDGCIGVRWSVSSDDNDRGRLFPRLNKCWNRSLKCRYLRSVTRVCTSSLHRRLLVCLNM